jgi:hypothetical protein
MYKNILTDKKLAILDNVFNQCHVGLRNDLLDINTKVVHYIDPRVRLTTSFGCRIYQQLHTDFHPSLLSPKQTHDHL